MKKTFLLLLIMLTFSTVGSLAQVQINAVKTDGTTQTITVSSTGEVYISGERIVVFTGTESGESHTLNIDDLQKITFSGELNIHQVDEIPTIAAYPNPASSTIALQGIGDGQHKLYIYNIDGKLVKQDICTDNTPIDISQLPQGVYLLRVDASTTKIIKY